jgi:hypothetical protein
MVDEIVLHKWRMYPGDMSLLISWLLPDCKL